MTGLLFILSKSKFRHWLPWKQKYFTVEYRNKYIVIKFACLIHVALVIDIEDSIHVFDEYS